MQSVVDKVRALPAAAKMQIGAGVLGLALLGGVLAFREEAPAPGPRRSVQVTESVVAPAGDAPRAPRPARKSFAEGKVEESHGEYKAAAENYAAAARKGDARGLKQLISMTRARKCEARSEAADALGSIHNKKATAALKKLSRKKYRDDSSGLFSCSSRTAAKKALEKQARG